MVFALYSGRELPQRSTAPGRSGAQGSVELVQVFLSVFEGLQRVISREKVKLDCPLEGSQHLPLDQGGARGVAHRSAGKL